MKQHKTTVRDDVPRQHQLKIAQKTMRLSCLGASLMGGMNHVEAARLLGVNLPPDCTCKK